ncbi:FAD-binding oxidoreductase [Tsukamurella sp. 8F]|uniref:ferredoxin reductase n=1 Tax=unclassified Tsukamurella TaxID=2633480 RepID=UPI0023BA0DB5|nr:MULTISPECIES: FAD-binding oxidoreductase [unclassified Tsukamurella]MDF0532614.1 FAD-binding oxidoreductase [Tsukamurella sp. 8J]MDF0588640.1 FAD-binding oxidoreductase [Tsukamurella sp. 8F]
MSRLKTFAGSVIQAALAPHAVDRYLELVDPMVTWTEIRGRVTSVVRRTDRTVTFVVDPTRQFDGFKAGQFIQLSVVIDGVRQSRCFSPATSEHDRRLEFTVTAHDDGFVSAYLRDNLKAGDVVGLTQAAGTFALPARRPRDIRLISGGSGITPVLSMLRTLVDEGHRGTVELLHFCRDEADNPYRAELSLMAEQRGVNVRYVYTRAGGGYFTADHLPELGDAAFACGPAPLLAAVSQHYADRGAADLLAIEEFTPPATVAADADATGTLTFTESSATAENDGRSILDQAESAGLFPESGCRMGICFSCTAVRKAGCTKNLLTGETDSEPDQHIQLCVSAPVGDVAVEI